MKDSVICPLYNLAAIVQFKILINFPATLANIYIPFLYVCKTKFPYFITLKRITLYKVSFSK